MNKCDACGKKGITTWMGRAHICRQCEPDVRAEMERLRVAGEPVNVNHIARKIFREQHSVGNYILRDIPDDIWKRAKHRAVEDNDSLRDVVLKALDSYLLSTHQ